MTRIALITSPGLAPITQRELDSIAIQADDLRIHFLRNHDLITFDIEPRDIKLLTKLRTVEDIFIVLHECENISKKEDLKKLIPRGFKDKLISAMQHLPPRKSKKPTTDFTVFVKQDRDHEVFRKDIARVISTNITENFNKWRLRDPAEIELWCFLFDSNLVITLRITSLSFRQRSYRDDERIGSLKPTIAAAMVVLSDPKPSDLFIDPMCGSGTILFERVRYCDVNKIYGCDIDSKAAQIASNSAQKFRTKIEILQTDSTDDDFALDGNYKFDKIVCNLPFGKQYGDTDKLNTLYSKALSRWSDLLEDSGYIVVATPHLDLITKITKKNSLKISERTQIRVKGTKCYLLVLERS